MALGLAALPVLSALLNAVSGPVLTRFGLPVQPDRCRGVVVPATLRTLT